MRRDIIVNLVVPRSPPQTCIRFREKFLDNATAWAIDSTSVIGTFLFDSCSPPQTCKRLKEKIVGHAGLAVDSTNVIDTSF